MHYARGQSCSSADRTQATFPDSAVQRQSKVETAARCLTSLDSSQYRRDGHQLLQEDNLKECKLMMTNAKLCHREA